MCTVIVWTTTVRSMRAVQPTLFLCSLGVLLHGGRGFGVEPIVSLTMDVQLHAAKHGFGFFEG